MRAVSGNDGRTWLFKSKSEVVAWTIVNDAPESMRVPKEKSMGGSRIRKNSGIETYVSA